MSLRVDELRLRAREQQAVRFLHGVPADGSLTVILLSILHQAQLLTHHSGPLTASSIPPFSPFATRSERRGMVDLTLPPGWVLRELLRCAELEQRRSLIAVGQIALTSSSKAAGTRRFTVSSVPSS